MTDATLTNVTTGATLAFQTIDGFIAARVAENILHDIIGSSIPDVTLRPARARTGTFEFVCATRASGISLQEFACAPGVFSLPAADGMPAVSFVVSGTVSIRFQAAHAAVVTVPWTAVAL